MSQQLEDFKLALKKHNHSVTNTRLVVFDALQDKEPQTMHEIVEACVGQIDRASVYRTISLLERLAIVQRLQIGWKYKLELSDAFHHHHHHLTCMKCGKTSSLPEDPSLEKNLRRLARMKNFVMQKHQLEIQGLCQNCQRL